MLQRHVCLCACVFGYIYMFDVCKFHDIHKYLHRHDYTSVPISVIYIYICMHINMSCRLPCTHRAVGHTGSCTYINSSHGACSDQERCWSRLCRRARVALGYSNTSVCVTASEHVLIEHMDADDSVRDG